MNSLSGVGLPPYRTFFRFCITGKQLDLRLCRHDTSVFLKIPFGVTSCTLLLRVVTRIAKLGTKSFVRALKSTRVCLGRLRRMGLRLSHRPQSLPRVEVGPSIGGVFSFGFRSFRLIGCGPRPRVTKGISMWVLRWGSEGEGRFCARVVDVVTTMSEGENVNCRGQLLF